MEEDLEYEFRRLARNAAQKRDMLLEVASRQTYRRKRLNITAGVLSLLSAATVTSVLADYTPDPAMKLIAAGFSVISGLISLLVNSGLKDVEVLDLYTGASGYLSLRERANRTRFNTSLDDQKIQNLLEEYQDLYGELDLKYQRYIAMSRGAKNGSGSAFVPSFESKKPPLIQRVFRKKRPPFDSTD
ncbi:hypothetical protein [Larkinella soli]|uniref:hypothetical protein n=1 Tax=Larkinella soli TaxID=1770527 RepID=UPI000FFB0A23|nr:hypothetical protein [Larkinella soli]